MLNQAPPLAGLYEELRSALLAAARLHWAIARRLDDDPLAQRAHREAAARLERQSGRFARMAQEVHP